MISKTNDNDKLSLPIMTKNNRFFTLQNSIPLENYYHENEIESISIDF